MKKLSEIFDRLEENVDNLESIETFVTAMLYLYKLGGSTSSEVNIVVRKLLRDLEISEKDL